MKPAFVTALVSLSAPLAHAVAVPAADLGPAVPGLVARFHSARHYAFPAKREDEESLAFTNFFDRLFKRKGGGGSGRGSSSSSGKGGSSSSSSGKGGSSSSSSSSSSKGGSSSSSSSSSSGKGSSSSSTGGKTTTGSGVKPSYGGGTYYSGGSTVPYKSGATSPSGISPTLLGAGAGAGAYYFWPGTWYHPVYYYPYTYPHTYYNHSTNKNETKPVACGCDETVECSCDDNTNSTYFTDIVGNGTYSGLNKTVVNVADVNGTSTILINGTLANGTTATGGTESASAGASMRFQLHQASWLPAAVTLFVFAYML